MNEIQQVILHAQARFRTIRIQRAILVFIAFLVFSMTIAALLDQTWMFSGPGRWIGWIGGLIVAILSSRQAAGPVCPEGAVFARKVESDAGESVPVVSTSLDPSVREVAQQDPYGQVLLSQLDQRAESAIRKAPPNFKGRLTVPAGLLLLAGVAVYAMVSLQGWQGLQRMFLPWEHSPYTTLLLEGPQDPVAEGQSFELVAKIEGVVPEKVFLYLLEEKTPLAEAKPDPHGHVTFSLDGRDRETVFIAKAGDGKSEPLVFSPYLLPRIQSYEISVSPPSYANRRLYTEARPSFSVFRGSQVHYRLHLAAPATGVTIHQDASPTGDERISEAERANLVRGAYGVMVGKADAPIQASGLPAFKQVPGEPLAWETHWEFPSPGDVVYRLKIEGERGDIVQNEEPWRINVLEDRTPEIHIDHHNGNDVIKQGKETVQFVLRASDDVGIAKIRLVYRKPGDPHQSQSVTLPDENIRDWNGPALLDLAPLKLSPLDIVAVHAEVEDTNTMEGPGIARSEVVFLEVPFPDSDDSGEGAGGGGGGSAEPINPLQLQMEILKSTMALGSDAHSKEIKSLAHDQRQNAGYTGQIERMANGPGLEWLASALKHARQSMEKAAQWLDRPSPANAIPEEEAALGFLVDAAKLLDDAIKEGLIPPKCEADGMTFTLRPPRNNSSESDPEESESEDAGEKVRQLVEEVKRQLEKQETLNRGEGDAQQRAQQQSALSQDAQTAAKEARSLPSVENSKGNPKAAAEALERAARYQEENTDALTEGDHATSTELGEKSAEALDQALQQLSAQFDLHDFASDAHPEGFEKLVNDYLRSISYE